MRPAVAAVLFKVLNMSKLNDLNTLAGQQILLELLEEAHLIVVDPDSDGYFDGNRLDNLLIRSIKLLKGEPL
jgi:hypothetical protein